MEYILIPFLTLLASILTFFSGFGLGTILLPAFILFFPITIAITLTAIVHFINNLFKLAVIGKHANKRVVIKFGLPALTSAFLGAVVLNNLSGSYLKTIIGLLIIVFAIFELLPISKNFAFNENFLPIAGILSGFFGGLSGHQGALRSAFLIKCNLSKESFIGTGVVIACLVDMSRITGYGYLFGKEVLNENILLLILCIVFALIGVIIGNKLIKKVILKSVQLIVSFVLILVGVFLISGVL